MGCWGDSVGDGWDRIATCLAGHDGAVEAVAKTLIPTTTSRLSKIVRDVIDQSSWTQRSAATQHRPDRPRVAY